MNYHKITKCDTANGTGVRVTLWLSGCNHKCNNCHNPQTWNPDSGSIFDKTAKDKLFDCLNKDYIKGITFSGGDPLYENNLNELLNLIIEIKTNYPNKDIWLYSGYTWEDIFGISQEIQSASTNEKNLIRQKIITLIDVFVDGKYIDNERDISLKFRGSRNQRVIDVKKTLSIQKTFDHANRDTKVIVLSVI